MKVTTLLKKLQNRYPGQFFQLSENFDGRVGGIWSGEGVIIDNMPAFDYYLEYGYGSMVHPNLEKFLEKCGYFAEPHDSGTWFFWKI